MKLLKKSKPIRTRILKSTVASIDDIDRFIKIQMYAPKEYNSCSFPHGNINIAKERAGYFLNFWPVAAHLENDDEEERSEKMNDVLWLSEYKNNHPNYPAIYCSMINYFEKEDDNESWKKIVTEFSANCKETPYTVFQEMYFQEIVESKKAKELLLEYGHITNNLHAAYPSRNCFYMEEVFGIIGFYFVEAINSKRFDIAQQYINTLADALHPEDYDLIHDWRQLLIKAKRSLWRKIFPIASFWSLLSGVIALVCWIIYKIGGWVASLI